MPSAPQRSYVASVRGRRLAKSLQQLRDAAGLSQETAASRLGWSQGKVGHLEKGRNKPSERDVGLLLNLYGAGAADRATLLVLAREAERRGWWTDYSDLIDGAYVPLEDEASIIHDWAPQVIPGLIQTQDYAREIFTAFGPSAGDEQSIERRLKVRMLRQTLLTRAQNPPSLRIILDEAVLERPIGSPDIMRDQLYRLRSEARRPNVSIRILPKAAGTHPGLEGSLIILRFPDPEDPDVGYHEGIHGGTYLENPLQVARCNVAMELLQQAALTTEESVEMITAAANK